MRTLRINSENGQNAIMLFRFDLKVERLILALTDSPLGTSELLKALHVRDRNYLCEGYIRLTLRTGFIEQTKPEVKHSKLQKYRLAAKGRECLAGLESHQQ